MKGSIFTVIHCMLDEGREGKAWYAVVFHIERPLRALTFP